ncbi:M20/M25/M40 family metallo-hydrolase [Ruegeria sp. HKCCD8929]|uniref:M20/M25/M40 family metallo-hydrolase n=1 Tax=Ruegeria sp. HKCCD8929 TaxID=2683006 RepID=UPI0014897DBE|nr:M20/M25/M40 family metallo-hydrolase [Ruegeria sp. HKCCD8929]
MSSIEAILSRADKEFDQSIARLFELMRIESVSADPACKNACFEASEWVRQILCNIGFNVSVYATAGHPIVLGHYRPAESCAGPHLLFYGHYDVQPPDPLDLWERPPFDPYIGSLNGQDCIVGRGACDDKGQMMTFIEAMRVIKQETGDLPLKITVIVEGEEEILSPSLGGFLAAHRELADVDYALICDTNMWDAKTPAITTRLRGTLSEEIVVTGPDCDLHSGSFGGTVINPIQALTHVLGRLHTDCSRVNVPGFYDGISDLPAAIKTEWNNLIFDETEFLSDTGLNRAFGEPEYTVLERLWARPTLEFNGIFGGYSGEGLKAIIPSKAGAKITCRLVPGQNPEAVRTKIRAFVVDKLPDGVTAEFLGGEACSAVEIDVGAEVFSRIKTELTSEWGKPAAMIGCGGSIPVVQSFQNLLGIDSILIGFGLADDATHSPNEKYNLKCFRGGIRSWVRILTSVATMANTTFEK